jgi:hypothetical protein
MPVIECAVNGKRMPFPFDTGASSSFLSIRYYKEFRIQAKGWKKAENATGGGGGMVRRKVYLQRSLDLGVGTEVATIRNVTVFPTQIGSDKDEHYGILGQDVVAGFESYTLDVSTMTFTLGVPLHH